MSDQIQGLDSFDPGPGEYAIVPSEWCYDMGAQLGNLTSGSEGDTPMWHLYNVETARGRRVLEVFDDRRGMSGTFDTSGRQFLLQTPDGDPLMAFEREGAAIGTPTTLRAIETGETLGSWETTSMLTRNWQLWDGGGTLRLDVKRKWSLDGLFYPTYRFVAVGGDVVGRLDMRQEGLFYEADVTIERSAIPPAICLALACGIFWSMSQ